MPSPADRSLPIESLLVLHAVPGERGPILRGIVAAGGVVEREDDDPLGRGTDLTVGALRVRLVGIGLLARRLERAWPPSQAHHAVLLVGLAGGLDPALRVGDSFLVDRLADSAGPTPLTQGEHLDRAFAGFRLGRASLWTSPRIVLTPEEKARLRQDTAAALVDMESSLVAREAARRRVPIAILRTIVDGAADTVPLDFEKLVRGPEDDRIHPGKLCLALLAHPLAYPGLRRLRRAARAAGVAMEEIVREAVSRIAGLAGGGAPVTRP